MVFSQTISTRRDGLKPRKFAVTSPYHDPHQRPGFREVVGRKSRRLLKQFSNVLSKNRSTGPGGIRFTESDLSTHTDMLLYRTLWGKMFKLVRTMRRIMEPFYRTAYVISLPAYSTGRGNVKVMPNKNKPNTEQINDLI